MMPVTVCKQFKFSAAHQLHNHDGLCKNLHGHTYKLEVLVTGVVVPPDGAPDEGMLLDFGEIKKVYEEHLEEYLEHRFLNSSLAGTSMPTIENPQTGMPEALTTAEILAGWIYEQFRFHLLGGEDNGLEGRGAPKHPRVRAVCIRLWESPTSFAEAGETPWRG